MKKLPWKLEQMPRGEEVLRHYSDPRDVTTINAELYDDLFNYHRSISKLPSTDHYDLMVAWVFHTYLLENAQYSPILCLFAVPERGKTRTGKGLIYVAYRGIHVESLSEAYILRLASNLKATIFFDVKDMWKKAERNGSEDIVLQRFERGVNVARVHHPELGPFEDTAFYSVFGPTIIGTNEGVHRILETRSMQINMPESSGSFQTEITPAMGLSLKERLIAFRARYLGVVLPDVSKPAVGRLGDMTKPLLQIIRLVRPDREGFFLYFIKDLEDQRRIDKADTVEAQVIRSVIGLRGRVVDGLLPVKAITVTVNEGRGEQNQLTPQYIGRRLAALGFKKGPRRSAGATTQVDDTLIASLVERYGINYDECAVSVVSPNSPGPFTP